MPAAVRIAGTEVAGWPTHRIARAGVGIVFQHSRPLHRQTVLENIKLALLPDSLLRLAADAACRRRARARSPSASASAHVLHRHPPTLPFADLRRLELAKAIARDPKVVLVDEPFAGLTAGEVADFSDTDRRFPRRGPRRAAGRSQRQGRGRAGGSRARHVSRRARRRGQRRRGDARTRRCAASISAARSRRIARPELDRRAGAPLLDVRDVVVLYGKAQALQDVSLHVREREFVSVVGLNGAGKTTLFNAICGLVPYGGDDRVGGRGAARAQHGDDRARRHRAVPGDARTVRRHERAREPGSRRPAPDAGRTRRAQLDWLFELFPILSQRERQAARTLSGGEQQMLAIARALMMKPRLLILDEPTLGLAPVILEQLSKALAELRRTTTITVLLGEQNVTFALPHADRVYVLEHARIVWEGDPARFAEEAGAGYL